MTRLLAMLVTVELLVGGVLVYLRLSSLRPPIPSQSEWDSATREELEHLAAGARSAEGWAKYAEALLAVGAYPEAEAGWREARRLEPLSAEHAFRHGFALERLGAIAEANDAYRAALALGFRRKSDLQYYLGRNLLRLEDVDEAAKAFAEAGSLPGARLERAKLDARAGRATEADAEAERLSDSFPDSYPPLSLRIRLAMDRSDRAAETDLADAFVRRHRPLPTPFDTEVDWVMGRANAVGSGRLFRDAGREMNAGRLDAAEARLREALDARWQPEVADKLAEVAFARGRRDEAHRILAEVLQRGGPSPMALWRLGQAENATGSKDRALASWRRGAALATGPTGPDLFQDLADMLERDGIAEEAKAMRVRSLLAMGIAALDAGRLDEACTALERAVQLEPKSSGAWQELGDAHRHGGRGGDARTAYENALRLDPDCGRAIRGRALLPK